MNNDAPPTLIQPSLAIGPVPPIQLELTLPDNTQQVIALDSASPAERWRDVWTVAYREAVASFDKEVQGQIMHAQNFEHLLKRLDDMDEANKTGSAFRRGLDHLQGSLETCKMVLDFAAPFLSMEPTAATATGIVQGVTTIAIGICGAASQLSGDIRSMLDCMPRIDMCDALSQNAYSHHSIHEALVQVYKDLLNFYLAALNILNSEYYLLKVVANSVQKRIPTITNDFVGHVGMLDNLIQSNVLHLVQGLKMELTNMKVERLLGCTFREADDFHNAIKKPRSDQACSWISQDARFKEWHLKQASGNLLLLGDMGCGKTVTANYIIDEVMRHNNAQVPKTLTCYHYCKKDLTSNSEKILSSLILQLLFSKSDLARKEFCDWADERKQSTGLYQTGSLPELKAYLENLVGERPLYVILDGLDECTPKTFRELVSFIAEFSEKRKTPPLKFCLTSRQIHGRLETLQKSSLCIPMIEDAQRDAVLVRHMVELELSHLNPDLQSKITKQLAARARGSAVWIKVSIDILGQLEDDTKNMQAVDSLLKRDIYDSELSQLYSKLFSRIATNSSLNSLLCTALEILAVSKRPLTGLELQWALALSQPDRKKVISEINESAEVNSVKYLLKLLQPFITKIDNEDPSKTRIRLVHDSVRELVLRSSPSTWEHLSKEENPTRVFELEAKLLALCVEYLTLDEIDQKDLFDLEQRDTQTFWDALPAGYTDSDDSASDHTALDPTDSEGTKPIYYDPVARGFGGFFVYASCFWIEHLKSTPVESFPTISTIIAITRAKSRRLSNWYQQSFRPDCTLLTEWDDNIDRLDPLIFMSLHGPVDMMVELLARPISETYFTHDSVEIAIEEIILHGDVSRLKYFIEQRDSLKSLMRDRLIHHWATKDLAQLDGQKWDECFDLVLSPSENLMEQGVANELLCKAVKFCCYPVVKKLFYLADNNLALRGELLRGRLRDSSRDLGLTPYSHQSVGIAVRNIDLEMLHYLLNQAGIEEHLNHVDTKDNGVLHIAALVGSVEVFKLLLPHLKAQVNRINKPDNKPGATPLEVLVFTHPNKIECAKVLLIEGEAKVAGSHQGEGDCPSWYHPLRIAVRAGSIEMCRVLVEIGHADPRVALNVHNEEALLLDQVNLGPRTSDHEKIEMDILAMLSSFAGVKPSRGKQLR
ncbi:hypothetical protein F4803DRAFT_504452 [Xylaria telfairii]|nr:hypothetical protein F4803DRAFT_504452 [Xylaria telfairii]